MEIEIRWWAIVTLIWASLSNSGPRRLSLVELKIILIDVSFCEIFLQKWEAIEDKFWDIFAGDESKLNRCIYTRDKTRLLIFVTDKIYGKSIMAQRRMVTIIAICIPMTMLFFWIDKEVYQLEI